MKTEKSKHTPGPWSVNDINPSDIYGYERGTKRGRFVATAVNFGSGNCCHTEEDRANAHLIAAAPELLAALEKALLGLMAATSAANREGNETAVEVYREIGDIACAALAKAKGK